LLTAICSWNYRVEEQKQQMLEVLRSNKGFTKPERWLEYALLRNFKKVRAEELRECPDCGHDVSNAVGQYVYYSTLVRVQECARCGLLFSDKRIDPQIIRAHFEHGYKGEAYFQNSRRRIFEQIAALADFAAARGGHVLDIGGAKGHLLALLRARRPDLHFSLNDLSEEACDFAAREFGFQTFCGDAGALQAIQTKYDLILLSDVIYYEPRLRLLWASLARLVASNGVLIIRVPNKALLIRLWQRMLRAGNGQASLEMQDQIRFFNPEHLYVFTRRYLLARLKGLGFTQVTFVPSELLGGALGSFWQRAYFALCKMLAAVTCGRWILTPGLLVIAKSGARTDDTTPLDSASSAKARASD
jgi:SAM-dependent methyltransferase